MTISKNCAGMTRRDCLQLGLGTLFGGGLAHALRLRAHAATTETIGMPTYRIAHLGIAYCPEERGIFSSLTVEENLVLPPEIAQGGMSLEEIFEMFPNLRTVHAHS